MSTKACDNLSVGVLITDHESRLLLITRATPPFGRAPVAGHHDDHGSAEATARAEVQEETGLTVTRLELAIPAHWRDNVCRRRPGPRGTGHTWTIFHASVTGGVHVDPAEARDASWYTHRQLQHLADRTVRHARGLVTVEEFTADPGLQPIWIAFLAALGLVAVNDADAVAVTALANGLPPSGPTSRGEYPATTVQHDDEVTGRGTHPSEDQQ